jgi:hypothetical protein
MRFSLRNAGLGAAGAPSRSGIAATVLVGSALAATVFFWSTGGNVAPSAGMERQFRDAARAYSEGRFAEAAGLYENLARGGSAATEVFYNLGNAYFKDGRLGPAVLSYRKAWALAPRDPDVGANLRLALQAAGAAEADLSSAEIAFVWLSEREWGGLALIGWWTTCLGLALATAFRTWRPIALRLVALPAAVTVAALCGLGIWHGFAREPEFVILHESQNALTAPMVSASPRFSLPEGSVVRARGNEGEWVSVTHGQLSGWVRRAAGAPVLLETSAK